jgi:hypothetical protein
LNLILLRIFQYFPRIHAPPPFTALLVAVPMFTPPPALRLDL